MKAGQVHDLADDQLLEFVGNARQEIFNLRFQHATGQLENTARMGTAKRDLARGLTVAHQRGIDVEAELARQKRELNA
jgi:large subunit ribosomal protein L29